MNGNGGNGDTHSLIIEFLSDRIGVEVTAADDDLIESGQLDSLALVMLISAIEETFLCELPLDDFDIDRFRSVERIVEFLQASSIIETSGS